MEHALEASGIRPGSGRDRRSTAGRIRRALRDGLLGPPVTEADIRAAISTRHDATHGDHVPQPSATKAAVSVLREVWEGLRRSYVCVERAQEIAVDLAACDGVDVVALYGSLARGETEANDIDLLVIDDGRHSKDVTAADISYADRRALTKKVLEHLGLLSGMLEQVVLCRWLDLLLLDGTKLGQDRGYTDEMAGNQPDPYFFLNIAQDLRQFGRHQDCFVDLDIAYFRELQQIARSLASMGIRA